MMFLATETRKAKKKYNQNEFYERLCLFPCACGN